MKNLVFLIAFALLCICSNSTNADLLDCNEKILPSFSDERIIGPKVANSEENDDHKVRDFFKNVGCQLKKGAEKVSEQAKKLGGELKVGAEKVSEQAKKLGGELKEGAKKWGAKAKDLGSDIKVKFGDFKDKFSSDSSDERISHDDLRNVEIINPDLLKLEQQCGHGHILDALGNCSKLRK